MTFTDLSRLTLLSFAFLIMLLFPFGKFAYGSIAYAITAVFLFNEILYKNIYLKDIHYLILCIFALAIINPLAAIKFVPIFLLLFSFTKPLSLSNSYNKRLTFFVYFLIFCALSYITFSLIQNVGRIKVNQNDPNFSALSLLLLFYLTRKLNMQFVSYFIIFLGALTLSRNFYLAIFIYFSFIHMRLHRTSIVKFFSKHFGILLIASHIFLILLSFFWVAKVGLLETTTNSSNRLLNFADNSNDGRFNANIIFFTIMISDFSHALFGYSELRDLFFQDTNGFILPHNSTFQFTIKYGILLSIFYFALVSRLVNRFSSNENIPIIFSYVFFSLFLHNLYEGYYFIAFIAILALNKKALINTPIHKS